MKIKILYAIAFLFAINNYAQTNNCVAIVDDKFETAGALPEGWTEYNTSGRVTVEAGKLKFNHNTTQPSAYRTFNSISSDATFSFEVSATRASVNCQVHLISSTGKYLSSVALGKNGTATIKHATSMTNGIPSGFTEGTKTVGFPANKVFTISTKVNFDTKKIDIYIDDELAVGDMNFLEEAEDIAKIDIQLLYMYANNGQFYFDNISLLSGQENLLLLTNNVTAAQNLLNSAEVGTIYNQYPQAAVDTFQLAIDNAKTVLADCNAESSTIDAAISSLSSAKEAFEATRINDPVLKLFNGYDFSGEEHEVYPGYYNGGLGEHEDWAISFTLEKGYMATFAADINGLGASKVYIAQDDALAINLPANLQKTISFIRVSPWYPVAKKGSLGGDIKWSSSDNYNTTWHYSWGLNDLQANGVEFVPMSWSTGDNWTSLTKMEEVGKNMSFNHLLAFNEPDNKDQSNLTVEEALEAYPKLLASGLRIGAPGVENVQYSANNNEFNEGSWIQRFMDSCVARGYRVDFIPAHDYVRRNSATFIERFKALHDRYNLPVWVTEYNYGNPNFGSANLTVEQGYTNIKSLTEALEAADFVERYNWYYFFGANTGIGGITSGALNITGQFYRDLQSQNPSYIQEVYEQGALSVYDTEKNIYNLSIYPNPVNTAKLTINFGDLSISNDTVIKLFNTLGQEVLSKKGVYNQIDVSTLNNGIYLVKISSENINVTKKIIINRQ